MRQDVSPPLSSNSGFGADTRVRSSAGNHDISYQRFCELVMGQDRMDNSSLVMASKHSANDIHSNSEMLMRKRIRESGKDLRQVSLRRHTRLAPRQGCVLPAG